MAEIEALRRQVAALTDQRDTLQRMLNTERSMRANSASPDPILPCATAQELKARAEQLIAAVDAVQKVPYCFCGQPKSAHTYWEERVYDVNGYRCPGVLGGEYGFDRAITDARYRDARVDACVCYLLAACEALEQELKAGDDGYPSSEDVDFAVIQALRARAEAAEARVQELEKEEAAALADPAEQRAERYAMEALELSGKLIAAEAQVQALEQERDSITRQLKADASNERECRVANQDRLRTALEQIDDLQAELARLQDYAQHRDGCYRVRYPNSIQPADCTCGLLAPTKAQS